MTNNPDRARILKRFLHITTVAAIIWTGGIGQTKRPITIPDLLAFGRATDPHVSPDGKWVAFVVTYHSAAENTTNSNIWLVPVGGGGTIQLTSAKGANYHPRWLNSTVLAFLSSRDGESQIWTISTQGGEARKLTSLSTEAAGLEVSLDGSLIAFPSEVFPDCDTDDCNARKNAEMAKSKSKAKIFDKLPYRVWNAWKDGRRSHLFVQAVAGGAARDVTPGDADVPPIDLGGSVDYSFSPDGKEVAFSMNAERNIAVSTNNDLFVVPVAGGKARSITDNPANDAQPLYSPDGRSIAYVAMARPGFEADRRVLMIYDRTSGSRRAITEKTDISVGEVVWSPDGSTIYFTADNKGNKSLFKVNVKSRSVEPIMVEGSNGSPRPTPDGRYLIFVRDRMHQPGEIYRADVSGKNLIKLTSINDDRSASLEMNAAEGFWFVGAKGNRIHGWLVKPPAFSASRKYPLVYLIHGGPQGQWADQFHYRWNVQLFASRGYVVAVVNPTGSTGYGQTLTDAISGDWAGAVAEDLLKGLDHLTVTMPFIDSSRIAAAGASYGGYMINWLAGTSDRFRCLVSHDGVFNPTSMYGTTEELWFPEWEFRGTPYSAPELFDRWSPVRNVSNFKTPTLVVHGQLDFRVDVSEGFQLFTALQRQGVPSKMLYFPDEGHWVMKPANAVVWYTTVLDWIDAYMKD